MFEQSILRTGAKTRRTWTVAVSFALQMVGVGVALLIPLVAFEKLPAIRLMPPLIAPPAPRTEPPRNFVEVTAVVRDHARPRPFVQPAFIPHDIARVVEPPEPQTVTTDNTVPFSIGPSNDRTVSNSVWTNNNWKPPQFEPPPQPQRKEPQVEMVAPTPVSRGVMQGRLINRVLPVYPPPARAARIQGGVNLQAIIGRDGRIRELQVLNGHPWLVKAALDAVGQWVYLPTTLSGAPVDVITTIEVKFVLGN